MKLIYCITPEEGDTKKSLENIRCCCEYVRYEGIPICGNLTFSYMDDRDRHGWYRENRGKELIEACSEVYVFTDEVTELMIAEIKYAQEKEKPVHFYDADRNKINYDALIINKRIGPGYRKVIADAHGDHCSGACPFGGECKAAEKVAEAPTVSNDHIGQAEAPDKPEGLMKKLFGRKPS